MLGTWTDGKKAVQPETTTRKKKEKQMPRNNRARPKRFWSVVTPERFAEGTATREEKTYYTFDGSELLYGELREVVESIMANEAADSGEETPMVPSEAVDATVAAITETPAITMGPEDLSARVEAIAGASEDGVAEGRTRWMVFQYVPIPSSMHAALVRAQRGEEDLTFEVRVHQRFTY